MGGNGDEVAQVERDRQCRRLGRVQRLSHDRGTCSSARGTPRRKESRGLPETKGTPGTRRDTSQEWPDTGRRRGATSRTWV